MLYNRKDPCYKNIYDSIIEVLFEYGLDHKLIEDIKSFHSGNKDCITINGEYTYIDLTSLKIIASYVILTCSFINMSIVV